MKKKIYSILALVLSLVFVLCSCGTIEDNEKTTDVTTDAQTAETNTETDGTTTAESTTAAQTTDAQTTTDTQTAETEEKYESVTDTKFENVRFFGRILDDNDGKHIDWTYSGFSFCGNLEGKVIMNVKSAKSDNYLNAYILHVVVDGKESIVTASINDKTVTLCDLERGYHTVEVRKTTEGHSGRFILESLRYNGALDTMPEEKKLKIEVIGDSISCGVGSYPEKVTGWDYLTHCDSWYSYGVMAARELDADLNLTSVSGWGVVHGSTDSTERIPDIYDLTSFRTSTEAKWDASKYVPDVVVVALGTNDISATPSERAGYVDSCKAFLSHLRELYPEANIIWMKGMMNDAVYNEITRAVEEMNDEKITWLGQFPDTTGGWGHPSYEAQVGFKDRLVKEINKLVK